MLFFLAVVITAPLAAYVCGGVLPRGRRLWRNEPRAWADGAVVLLTVALALYTLGLVFTWDQAESDYHACAQDRYGSPVPSGAPGEIPDLLSREVSYLPVRAVCRWSDGSIDAVPAWLNPSLFACLAAAALLAVRAVASRVASTARNG